MAMIARAVWVMYPRATEETIGGVRSEPQN